jgi:gamma-glutamyl:cysteine ligase YbdK (ATP-grasp superfamily)
MSIKDDIREHLKTNGRCTANEIARGIDYSHGYTRENAKEMISENEINGAKATRVPAVIINDNYEVLTGNRDYLLELVKRHAPSRHAHAKTLDIEELQKFVREQVADSVVGGPFRWEFWL